MEAGRIVGGFYGIGRGDGQTFINDRGVLHSRTMVGYDGKSPRIGFAAGGRDCQDYSER
jgi:hypothetical protein